MSKRILWILTISLSLAMTGLIVIQVKWIHNAIQLKDIQFQQLVNSTLNDVSRQLDQFYTTKRLNTIIEEKLSPDDDLEWKLEMEDPGKPGVVFKEKRDSSGVALNWQANSNEILEIVGDTVIVIRHSDNNPADTLYISEFHDKEHRRQLEKSLREREVLVTTIMKQMLLEDVSFDERVNQKQLEKILAKNFLDRGIDLSFEYSVISDNMKEVYSSEGFSQNTDYYYFRAGLLSDEILEESNYLYLYFPGQKALVRGSLGFLALSSMILTLLMIILFTFTLYVIFRQKKLSDVKNDFVNNMTHELKTPISTISLASQMLNDESIPQEKKNTGHISRIIQTESKRLGYQVERVLQMAVLDQGHLILKKATVDMTEILNSVVQNFKIQIESKQGKLEIIDRTQESTVFGDRVHLMNVITNLLDNALKYSEGNPEISIEMKNSGMNFQISIKDNGIGISKENQKKVFDKFFRVSTGNLHDVKGFGLGLSYVKLIIDQHGGEITLSSELNKGAKFTILLPIYNEK